MALILHIGHPKTGTSFLQNLMAMNSNRLEEFGYIYPTDFTECGYHDFKKLAIEGRENSGNGAPLFWELQKKDDASMLLDNLSKADSKSKVVISSELFFLYTEYVKSIVNRFRAEGHSILVVAFIPNIYRAVINTYLQNVRNHSFANDLYGFLVSPENWKYFRFRQVLEELRTFLNEEELAFLPYFQKGMSGEGIAKDFFTAIGEQEYGSINLSSVDRVNVSLSAEVFEAIRLANSSGNFDLVHRIIDYGLSNGDVGTKAFQYFFTSGSKTLIDERYREEFMFLQEYFSVKFGGGVAEDWSAENEPVEIHLKSGFLGECLSLFKNG